MLSLQTRSEIVTATLAPRPLAVVRAGPGERSAAGVGASSRRFP
jgi:hypothetical protein